MLLRLVTPDPVFVGRHPSADRFFAGYHFSNTDVGKAAVKVLADGWTAVTKDGSLSAHFEHTVAVTKDGPLVLTMRPVVAGR